VSWNLATASGDVGATGCRRHEEHARSAVIPTVAYDLAARVRGVGDELTPTRTMRYQGCDRESPAISSHDNGMSWPRLRFRHLNDDQGLPTIRRNYRVEWIIIHIGDLEW